MCALIVLAKMCPRKRTSALRLEDPQNFACQQLQAAIAFKFLDRPSAGDIARVRASLCCSAETAVSGSASDSLPLRIGHLHTCLHRGVVCGYPRFCKDFLGRSWCDWLRSCVRPLIAAFYAPRAGMVSSLIGSNSFARAQNTRPLSGSPDQILINRLPCRSTHSLLSGQRWFPHPEPMR